MPYRYGQFCARRTHHVGCWSCVDQIGALSAVSRARPSGKTRRPLAHGADRYAQDGGGRRQEQNREERKHAAGEAVRAYGSRSPLFLATHCNLTDKILRIARCNR